MISPNMQHQALIASLEPLITRERLLRCGLAVMFGVSAALVVLALTRAMGLDGLHLPLIAGVLALVISLAVLLTTVPSPMALARAADRQLGGQERLSTALDLALHAPQRRDVFARGLAHDARGLAEKLGTVRLHRASRTLTGWAGGVLMMAAIAAGFSLLWPPAGPLPTGPDATQASPLSAMLESLADEMGRDGLREDRAALTEIAEALERLAQTLADHDATEAQRTEMAGLLDAAVAAYGGDRPGEELFSDGSQGMPRALNQWATEQAISLGDSGAEAPRTLTRSIFDVALDVPDAGSDTDNPDAASEVVNPSAAVQLDSIDFSEQPFSSQTASNSNEGNSDFIPPNLVEGDPRAGQAIDVAGTGEADRQESMTATTAGRGTQGAEDAFTPSDSTRTQVMEVTQIIPMEGQRIRYFVEAEHGGADHAGVTLGALPSWSPLVPAAVERQAVDGTGNAVVARYFDRSRSVVP